MYVYICIYICVCKIGGGVFLKMNIVVKVPARWVQVGTGGYRWVQVGTGGYRWVPKYYKRLEVFKNVQNSVTYFMDCL